MSNLDDLLKNDGASIDADDDFEAINALYLERGWSDGLPVVPPTAAMARCTLPDALVPLATARTVPAVWAAWEAPSWARC